MTNYLQSTRIFQRHKTTRCQQKFNVDISRKWVPLPNMAGTDNSKTGSSLRIHPLGADSRDGSAVAFFSRFSQHLLGSEAVWTKTCFPMRQIHSRL
jgi:hypothetical protein